MAIGYTGRLQGRPQGRWQGKRTRSAQYPV